MNHRDDSNEDKLLDHKKRLLQYLATYPKSYWKHFVKQIQPFASLKKKV